MKHVLSKARRSALARNTRLDPYAFMRIRKLDDLHVFRIFRGDPSTANRALGFPPSAPRIRIREFARSSQAALIA
jgi:hypothetical protein